MLIGHTSPVAWSADGRFLASGSSDQTVRVVAVTNATYGHHGEMALPEVSLVRVPAGRDLEL